MSSVILWLGEYLLYFFAAQIAILWLLLPLGVFGIKRRIDAATDVQHKIIEELFRLRKTVETMPGATMVNSRIANRAAQEGAGLDPASLVIEDLEEMKREREKPVLQQKEKPASKAAKKEVKPKAKKKAEKLPAKDKAKSLHMHGDEEWEAGADDDEADFFEEEFIDDSVDHEDDSLDSLERSGSDPAEKMVGLPMRSNARQKTVVDIPEEDEIFEDDEGYFVYRGEKYEHLLDAMRQQQTDARSSSA